MKIAVLVKEVPDTTIGMKIAPSGISLEKEGLFYIINPLDMLAVEEAVRIKEMFGSGNVTVISMGNVSAERILRKCMAVGADKGILVSDPSFEGSDGYVSALILTKVLTSIQPDLILCGARSVDTNSAQVGPMVGELLGLEVICGVTKIEIAHDQEKAIVHRKVEHGNREVVETVLPALLTVESGLNEPRYPSLPLIIRAQRASIDKLDRVGLGLDIDSVGSRGSNVEIVEFLVPKPKQRKIFTPPSNLPPMERAMLIASGGITKKEGNTLEGNPKEIAESLVQFLEEHKIISCLPKQ